MYIKNKSKNENFSRVYRADFENRKLVLICAIPKDPDKMIKDLNFCKDPAVCGCGLVVENSDKLAFRQARDGYTEFYCGCKGWD